MSWRELCASPQPPEEVPSKSKSGDIADIAGFAESPPTHTKDSAGGFADIASSALEKKKHDLYLKNKTPVKTFDQVKQSTPHPTTRLIPSVLPLSAKSAESAKPIQPGWLVAYYDKMGRLRGGTDERQVGTVAACNHTFVTLLTGEQLPLSRIVGVASMNASGRLCAAWLVQRHGLDGHQEALNENQT